MAGVIDMAKFTFVGEQVMAISEMVFDEIVQAPEMELFHTIFPDILVNKEVGFIGEGGLVGVKNQGCDPIPQDWSIATRKIKWTPEEWEVLIHACYKDLQNTAAQYSLKKGTPISDFTDSDYMAVCVEVLVTAMKKFFIRLVWFNDVDAENIADGGIITDGVNIEYFNLIDGFWKQMIAQYSTPNNTQRVVIAENAGTTYATQKLNPANVQDYLSDMVFNANMVLRSQSKGFILCTQSFYDAYSKSLKGTSLESMYTNLTEGLKTLTYDGKPLVAVPVWDEMIKTYENTGTKLNNPHRAVYVVKEVLGVGVGKADSFGQIDIWYDKDSRKVKMEGMGIADAKLTNPDLFQIAI